MSNDVPLTRDDALAALATRHSDPASTVTRRVKSSAEVRGAVNWTLRVLVLVVFVTTMIMIGLPWLLAAAAGS